MLGVGQLEDAHFLFQLLRLLLKLVRGGRRMLDQRRVLLRDFIQDRKSVV